MDRRVFLKSAGHLIIGFHFLPLSFCSGGAGQMQSSDSSHVDAWIRLDTDGRVTLFTGKMELGQGIKTALKQIAAEELDVSIQRIHIVIADTGQTPDERYTAGSGSIEGSGMAIRQAAAEARQQLLQLGAKMLRLDMERLTIHDGIIKGPEGQQTSYWEVLQGKRLTGKITGSAPLKNPTAYQLVGKPELRDDLIAMATGESFYVQDIRLPNMLHARVVRPPTYSSRLISVPENKVKSIAGVINLLRSGDFLAVIAQAEYSAIKAWQLLRKECVWQTSAVTPKQESLYDDMLQFEGENEVVEEQSTATDQISQTHESSYQKPYQMHASIGPSCAIAQWQSDQLTVWTHSQGVYPLRKTLADLLDLPEQQIRAIGVPGSGCYGHNGADDVAADAAFIAYHHPENPIRLQWMREDEHQWEPYGSAMVIKLRGNLNNKGFISAWYTDLWSDTHSTRPSGQATHTLVGQYMDPPRPLNKGGISGGAYRNASPYYNIPTRKITAHAYQGPLRTSALRSLGAYANVFALESFIDELAALVKSDPLDFRKQHLKDPRALAVLEAVTEKVNWKTRPNTPLTGYGLAFAKYKNQAAYFAIVAEVVIDRQKKSYSIRKLTGAIDAGQTINPDGLKNQTEGGMIQSASWTLFEQVNYTTDGIKSDTWDNYPIMRFADVPETEVLIIDRPQEEPLGAGEAAQGPTAAAIANALFAASGTRIRELPLLAKKINWQSL